MILALASFLAGLVLGFRCRVVVLVPAVAFALLVGIVAGLAQQRGMTATISALMVAVVALQFGYLGGAAARIAVAWGRVPYPPPANGHSKPSVPG
jgi:hypothetical protein